MAHTLRIYLSFYKRKKELSLALYAFKVDKKKYSNYYIVSLISTHDLETF